MWLLRDEGDTRVEVDVGINMMVEISILNVWKENTKIFFRINCTKLYKPKKRHNFGPKLLSLMPRLWKYIYCDIPCIPNGPNTRLEIENYLITRYKLFLITLSVRMSFCLSVSHTFLKTLYSTTLHFTDILIKYKSFILKTKNILFKKIFKTRLCSYINLGFLQFHFISAKIYILQIYS